MSRAPRHQGLRALGIALVLSLCLSLGCEREALREVERQEIDRLLRTGASFADDPYVRAETMRVLELLAAPEFAPLALAQVDDKEPMVRVGALRALMASRHPEVAKLTLARYTLARDPERRALLDASLDYDLEGATAELIERALRSKSPELYERAFARGPLARLERARQQREELLLKNELMPAMGKLTEDLDSPLAAEALRALVRLGDVDRAQPMLKLLADEGAPLASRVRAARVLRHAQVVEAKPLYAAIIERHDRADTKRLGLPVDRVAPALLRQAVLGGAALGEAELVERAQRYLTGASLEDYLEVLDALALNASPEITISLKIAMQDSREAIRHRAITLYSARPDAKADAMILAMRQDDPVARRRLASGLVARFPAQWSQELGLQLQADGVIDATLRLLRDVITRPEDLKVIAPLRDQLVALTGSDQPERAAMAAYLLLLSDPTSAAYKELLDRSDEIHTRYVFLEHLAQRDARDSVPIFRRYFYDDLFALRLMSAAGLWRAFKSGAPGVRDASGADDGAAAPSSAPLAAASSTAQGEGL